MRAELLTELGRLAEIEDDWRRLAELRGNAFLTPEWYHAWFRTARLEQVPVIVAGRDDRGALTGVLPLSFASDKRPHALRFPGANFGDRFGLACAPAEESEFAVAAIAAIESNPDLPPLLLLHRIDEGVDWPERMRQAARRRLVLLELSGAELPYARVAGLDWEGYLGQRSQKFRQRIARGLDRALQRQGIDKTIRETENRAGLADDMKTLFRLHDLRHPGGESSISDPEVREFLEEFARAALDRGWLRLRILELDGQPASAYLGWRLGRCYSTYQSGFDPAWAEHRAGLLLLKDTFRAAIEEGVDEVDLLLGGEPFKWRFAPEPRRVRTLALIGARRPARVLLGAEAGLRRRGRGLAASRFAGPAARWLSRRLPGSG